MINGLVILFLVLATLFTLVHTVALAMSLYWYHWWFDVLMHFWGWCARRTWHAFSSNLSMASYSVIYEHGFTGSFYCDRLLGSV